LALNVLKKLVKNTDGSVSLKLSGDSLNNAPGAVETFLKLADNRFGTTPTPTATPSAVSERNAPSPSPNA